MHCLLSGRAWEQEVGRDVYREVKMCTFGVYLVVADRVFQIGQVGVRGDSPQSFRKLAYFLHKVSARVKGRYDTAAVRKDAVVVFLQFVNDGEGRVFLKIVQSIPNLAFLEVCDYWAVCPLKYHQGTR